VTTNTKTQFRTRRETIQCDLASLLGYASLNTVMIYIEPFLDDLAERMEKTENVMV
jgi:hypothetical protein